MKIIASTFFPLTASVAMAFAAPSVIDSAYNPTTGHTYFLLTPSDWLSAESAAVSLGGHLITINDQVENNWVFNQWGHTRSLLIGLTDEGNEGTFRWTSGETFDFSNWTPGEPNNAVGWGTGPENYVHMYADGWGSPGLWNDYSGGADIFPQPALQGVVEVPEPAVGSLFCLGGLAICARLRRPTKESAC